MTNELFERAPVAKAYFKMALPLVFSMVISLVYNMVDTYFVARTLNTDLVAGVALCAPVFSILLAVGDVFGLGGSSVISRLFGSRETEHARQLSASCFYGALAAGFVFSALLLLFRRPVLMFLGAADETMEYALEYYTVIALGAPLVIVSNTPSNFLRTEGHSSASMLGSVIGSVVNMVLDPIFIFTLGLGASGAAIATVIGNACTAAFFVYFLKSRSKALSIDPREIKFTRFDLKQVLSIGVPASFNNLMQALGMALTNRFLLPFGSIYIAAMGIVMKINLIAVLILVGFAFGAQPLIGFNYGSGNRKRLGQILRFSYIFECSVGLFLTLLLSYFAPQLIKLLMDDETIVNIGVEMLRMQLMGMAFAGFGMVSTVVFQSTGKAVSALLLSLCRQGVLYAIVIFLCSRFFGYRGVISAQAVTDVLTAGFAAILLARAFLPKISEGTAIGKKKLKTLRT